MSFTVRCVLVDKPNKVGSCPIKICVTVKGKRTYMSTGYRVKPTEWDEASNQVKRTHRLAAEVNQVLTDRVQDIQLSLLKKSKTKQLHVKHAKEESAKMEVVHEY